MNDTWHIFIKMQNYGFSKDIYHEKLQKFTLFEPSNLPFRNVQFI